MRPDTATSIGGLTTMPGSRQIADVLQGHPGLNTSPNMARIRGFLAGGAEGLMNTFASPLSIATAAAGPLIGAASEAVSPLENLASRIPRISGAGLTAAGKTVADDI